MKKTEKSLTGVYFLLVVILFYIIALIIKPSAVLPSLNFSLSILAKIIPILILVFVFMVIINQFITPKFVNKHLGEASGIKRWFIAVVGGIISTGPIYMWYPMLKELKKKGVNYGFITAFLYNRAVKIPLLPILIFYFGLSYTIILTIVMIFTSMIQGLIFEKLEKGGLI